MQETLKGQPTIGLDHLRALPAAEQHDLRCACLQGRAGIVESRGASAEHRDPAVLQRHEINIGGGMRPPLKRQGFDRGRHPPAPHSVLAGGEHDFAGMNQTADATRQC